MLFFQLHGAVLEHYSVQHLSRCQVKLEVFSHALFFATPWTVACQAPLSMEFSWQEYWSGFAIPFSRDLPNPRIEPRSPALQADSLPTEPPGTHFIFFNFILFLNFTILY